MSPSGFLLAFTHTRGPAGEDAFVPDWCALDMALLLLVCVPGSRTHGPRLLRRTVVGTIMEPFLSLPPPPPCPPISFYLRLKSAGARHSAGRRAPRPFDGPVPGLPAGKQRPVRMTRSPPTGSSSPCRGSRVGKSHVVKERPISHACVSRLPGPLARRTIRKADCFHPGIPARRAAPPRHS